MRACAAVLTAVLLCAALIHCKHRTKPWDSDESSSSVANFEELQALGYIDYAESPADLEKTGASVHVPSLVASGYNLYGMAAICEARLISLTGEVIRTWSMEPCTKWRAVELLPDGDLAVVGFWTPEDEPRREFVARYSWDGQIKWKRTMTAHHDIEAQPDGTFVTLTLGEKPHPAYEKNVLEDYLTFLDSQGHVKRRVSILEMLRSNKIGYKLRKPFNYKGKFDVTHANSVNTWRNPALAKQHPMYREGNILVSTRYQNSIFIFNPQNSELVWAWGQGVLQGPHDATPLANGNILLFDNGLKRGWSRVLEVDPRTKKIVWSYEHRDGEQFYTRSRGAAQRLENGNTLICNSNAGQVIEVTPDKKVVWEFNNPVLNKKDRRAVILRARRLNDPWLAALVPRFSDFDRLKWRQQRDVGPG